MSALLTRWRRIALTGLLAGGLAAGSALVAVPSEAATVKNLVSNGSAETVAKSVPKGWAKGGSGVNTRVLTTVNGGAAAGKKFVRASITQRRSGSAWWFTPVATVRGGASYTFGESYRSGSPTVINAYFTVGGKTVGKQVAAVPASARWKAVKYSVTAPAGATKVRFGHILSTTGSVDVDNVSLVAGKANATSTTPRPSPSTTGLISLTFDDGWANQHTNALPIMKSANNMPGTFYLFSSVIGAGEYMSVAQAKELQAQGSEIGSHTVSHINLDKATPATVTKELADSKKALEANFGPVTSFAYPYGASSAAVRAETAKYYTSARSTNSGPNAKGKYDKYALTIGYVLNTTPQSTVQSWINEAKNTNTWLVLCYHRIANDQPNDPYTLSVPAFKAQIDAVKASGVKVVTVRDGIAATG